MAAPNTHREALIAELLGDVGAMLDRADDLQAAFPVAADAAAGKVRVAGEMAAGGVTAAGERFLSVFDQKAGTALQGVQEAAREAQEAARVVELERGRDPRRRPLLVVVTDGRASTGHDPLARAGRAAAAIAGRGIATLVIDCERGPLHLGLAATLAEQLRADHVPVAEVTSSALTSAVHERVA
ncbi:MAG TPA: hypothetical protein PK324_22615 [Nocardioides sp.]|nr:hypothetical protein [Nocardioides sp.]